MARLIVFCLFAGLLAVALDATAEAGTSWFGAIRTRNNGEDRRNLVNKLLTLKDSSNFDEFLTSEFHPYLIKSGLEEGYKQVMNDNIANIANTDNADNADSPVTTTDAGSVSPLTDYLLKLSRQRSVFVGLNPIDQELFALEFLSKLMSMSQSHDSDCHENFVREIKKYSDSPEVLYSGLRISLEKRLPGFLKACENNFKQKGEQFKEQQPDKWTRIEKLTKFLERPLYGPDGRVDDRVQHMIQSVTSYEKRRWDSDKSELEVTGVGHDLQEPCRAYMGHMSSSLSAIELISASADREVMNFLIPFDYCALVLYAESHLSTVKEDLLPFEEDFVSFLSGLVSCRRELRQEIHEEDRSKYELYSPSEEFLNLLSYDRNEKPDNSNTDSTQETEQIASQPFWFSSDSNRFNV